MLFVAILSISLVYIEVDVMGISILHSGVRH